MIVVPGKSRAKAVGWRPSGKHRSTFWTQQAGNKFQGFMLIPQGSSRTIFGLGANGDQACSPKFEVTLVEYLLDDHITNTSTRVENWSIHKHERWASCLSCPGTERACMQTCRLQIEDVARWWPRYCAATTRHLQVDVNRWIRQLAFDQRYTLSGWSARPDLPKNPCTLPHTSQRGSCWSALFFKTTHCRPIGLCRIGGAQACVPGAWANACRISIHTLDSAFRHRPDGKPRPDQVSLPVALMQRPSCKWWLFVESKLDVLYLVSFSTERGDTVWS